MGADPNLYSNLQTFFTMDYPQVNILLQIFYTTDPYKNFISQSLETIS